MKEGVGGSGSGRGQGWTWLSGGRGMILYDVNGAAGGHINLSTNFFRAPIAYSIFRALKYPVCCHRCDNIGRGCATWEASIN